MWNFLFTKMGLVEVAVLAVALLCPPAIYAMVSIGQIGRLAYLKKVHSLRRVLTPRMRYHSSRMSLYK